MNREGFILKINKQPANPQNYSLFTFQTARTGVYGCFTKLRPQCNTPIYYNCVPKNTISRTMQNKPLRNEINVLIN